MSKIEVDAIDKQSGSTLTLGGSGTAVTLAAGATQTGFGRTGTVDWQTAVKTSTFTAASGEGYFCNTTAGAFTLNLPSSPSVGDIVSLKDYAGTFSTNNLTLGRGGSNINGSASDFPLNSDGTALTLVYADATKGWLITEEASNDSLAKYVTATGGTITCCGNFKIHTFTGPGTFTVSSAGNSSGSNTVDYMVVAGGGGGGNFGGGGGGGGYRESSGVSSGSYTISPLGACVSALPVSAQGYPITVGSGGAGYCTGGPPKQGASGSNSIFSTITSTGGGGGGGNSPAATGPHTGFDGGSGGGASNQNATGAAGSGNTPPVSPSQGNNGGLAGGSEGTSRHGGGGGATTVGGAGTGGGAAGGGGTGATSCITGSPVGRAGGGGGGSGTCNTGGAASPCGSGEPGAPSPPDKNAAANRAGGGGGGHNGPNRGGGNGGSGIVVIRYKFQ